MAGLVLGTGQLVDVLFVGVLKFDRCHRILVQVPRGHQAAQSLQALQFQVDGDVQFPGQSSVDGRSRQ